MRDAIRARAREEGFDAVGFASADAPQGAAEGLTAFLDQGLHGDMGWMETTSERRADPKRLWSEAKSIITLGVNYAPSRRSLGGTGAARARRDFGLRARRRLSRRAEKAVEAARLLDRENYGGDVKIFVDTAPVMEKPLAASAGIGWQGKHTNLVSREFGSWLFLGSIFTTLELDPDEPERDIAAPAQNVWTSARPTPSPRRTESMRGAASLI